MLNDIVAWFSGKVEQIVYELQYLTVMEWSGTVWIVILIAVFIGFMFLAGIVGSIEQERQARARARYQAQAKRDAEKRLGETKKPPGRRDPGG
jgi:uncharacterized membrane protein